MEDLINGCRKYNAKAQSELYRLLSPKLYGLCMRYSANQFEAEDNLQETFIIIFEKIKQYTGSGSFEGWCKKIAVNQCLQSFRKQQQAALQMAYIEQLPEEVDEEISDEVAVPKEFLLEAVQDLPQKYRLVFNLYVFEGYSHNQIADALNIGVGGSKSNLSRARKILKNKIESFLAVSKIS